jgi:hypothetical protein
VGHGSGVSPVAVVDHDLPDSVPDQSLISEIECKM